MTTDTAPTPSAITEPAAPTSPAEAVLARLRDDRRPVHALWGFGPLVAAVVLAALIMAFAPSVAPEQIVERPVDAPAAETTEDGS